MPGVGIPGPRPSGRRAAAAPIPQFAPEPSPVAAAFEPADPPGKVTTLTEADLSAEWVLEVSELGVERAPR
jgi:hypothetical protein